MKNIYAIIGGDLRSVKLAQMLAKDQNQVYIFGLDNISNKELEHENITICNILEDAITQSNIVIGPIPFTRDGDNLNAPLSNLKIEIEDFASWLENKLFFAGSIPESFYKLVEINKISVLITDLMKIEELAILNIIATAEGAISELIVNTEENLQGSKAIILGFGRIGKVLSKKLEALGVKVTCAARKSQDLAWIEAYGHNVLNIYSLDKNLGEYDIIINTAPHIILDKEKLEYVKKDCLLLELASKPGGFDLDTVKELNLKYVPALGLPGKVAPKASAKYIKNTIYNLINNK